MAAYNEKNNVWETADVTSNWGSREDAENWVGYTPSTHYSEDLFLNWQYVGYFMTNYLQVDAGWYIITGGSFASSFITGAWGLRLGLFFTGLGILNDTGILPNPFGGPIPVTYPVLVFKPHYPPSPFQIGFDAP